MSMELSPAFFDLQMRFADTAAQMGHMIFEEALLNYTNMYIRLVGYSFDPTHPVWQAYLQGLGQAPQRALWTHAFYQQRREPPVPSSYGCFRYQYHPEEDLIRYHFVNADTSGYGPLSKERMPVRLQELKRMFAQIKQRYGDTPRVRGSSWLYTLDAYKRLFPAEYTRAMKVVEKQFQRMSLWGQFLQRDGRVRESLAVSFLSRLPQQKSLEDLGHCFPYQVLSPEGPIALLYEFYERLPS